MQWYTNNSAVAGATNPACNLAPSTLGNGRHQVRAVVRDNTGRVRHDPTNLLSQTVAWTVDVDLPQLQLDSTMWLMGGKFAFRITGNAPQGVVIQSSTNLLNWFAVATNPLVGGQLWYTNSAAAGSARGFYRAVTPP